MFTFSIIIVSDKGSMGLREDGCGPALTECLRKQFRLVDVIIVPDEIDAIRQAITGQVDEKKVDLVLTSGGTGVGHRDVTPEATKPLIDRDLPGFSEVMRLKSYEITPHGIISRGLSGIRKQSLIINLPGSPKAAVECLSFVLPAISHTLAKAKGDQTECATSN